MLYTVQYSMCAWLRLGTGKWLVGEQGGEGVTILLPLVLFLFCNFEYVCMMSHGTVVINSSMMS